MKVDADGDLFHDGQPVCGAGVSADFNNTVVFDAVRLSRHRLLGGLQFRFQMVRVGLHIAYEIGDPVQGNAPEDQNQPNVFDANGDMPALKSQYTLAFDLGAQF